jgi:hypothetical protein
MMRAAIQIRTPSAVRPAHVQAFTSSSTAAVATGASSECGDADGGWYTFIPTEDCHILWGKSDVAAATTSQMFYPAGVEFSKWLSAKEDSHLRVIRNSADGSLYWHKSES